MVPKDALSARGPGDARGFDPGGPGTRNSPMENPPTMSAVDEWPAMQEFSDETRRGVKNGAFENPEVPHGNSGTSDNLEEAPQSPPAPQSCRASSIEVKNGAKNREEELENGEHNRQHQVFCPECCTAIENRRPKSKNPGVTHGYSGTNDTAKAPQSPPAPQSCRASSIEVKNGAKGQAKTKR